MLTMCCAPPGVLKGEKVGLRKDLIVDLNPSPHVGVVASLVVAVLAIAVRRIEDEEMRHPVAV